MMTTKYSKIKIQKAKMYFTSYVIRVYIYYISLFFFVAVRFNTITVFQMYGFFLLPTKVDPLNKQHKTQHENAVIHLLYTYRRRIWEWGTNGRNRKKKYPAPKKTIRKKMREHQFKALIVNVW